MKIYAFGKAGDKTITQFDSKGASISRIIKHDKPTHIGCIHLEPGGNVGRHEATINQLFVVLNGQGWVTGKEGIAYRIKAGQAAYWEAGEAHESGTEHGMTAIVIESEQVEPLMTEIPWLNE
ncbi:cupin [Paenibacillus sp. MWE-103]|uniref:Cupin n=1 Tax=Paenibacillus artemisiicola TaxID=1172618 RepID=A0ABS3WJM1_9BACL|nr:cupin domain-containing protein [Paenibacillus artemisiicola]MBO7748520.1 cupin [Paenibacillus artemisiicola]